jgi:Fe-S-cluster containining protein
MFSRLLHLYQFIDQTMAVLFNQFPEEVKCHRGCTDCCHAAFDLSYIEAQYLLKLFNTLPESTQKNILERSEKAQKEWQEMIDSDADPAQTRIGCPLLNNNGECDCYPARPINCRTYGVPTVINEQAHVCGLSGFEKGKSYPTINLTPLQESLYQYSLDSAGETRGSKRKPIAEIILNPEDFGDEK